MSDRTLPHRLEEGDWLEAPRWRAEQSGRAWFIYDGDRVKRNYLASLWDEGTDDDIDEFVPRFVDWLNKEYP